jgi:hypothetical protein
MGKPPKLTEAIERDFPDRRKIKRFLAFWILDEDAVLDDVKKEARDR